MKPLTLKESGQQSKPEPQKISMEMAEQMADRAARKAADEAAIKAAQQVSDEAMNSFNKFQEQNRQSSNQPISQPENYDTDIEYDDEGGYSIDKKTEKNLLRRVLDNTLKNALDPPPDPIRSAMESGISQMATRFVETAFSGMGSQTVTRKPSLLLDVLNTAAAHGFGEQLGANLPQVIQSLTGAIGQQKAQELASAATKAMSVPQSEQQNGSADSSNTDKQKDMILALDVNNPDHVSQYASAMSLTVKAAKEMLQIHQNDIRNERNVNTQVSNQGQTSNNEITQALTVLIQEMTGMKQTISALQNEIVTIKGKKSDVTEEKPEDSVDNKWDDTPKVDVYRQQVNAQGMQQKNVTLFKSPIQVDIDDIKGDTNSFFNEPKQTAQLKQEESVLEEVIDDEGKSTFKMSNEKEQVREQTKEQPKQVIEVPKKPIEPLKEQPKKVVETPIEIEQDKKKETNSDVIESTENNETSLNEEPKVEETKIEENTIKKRIIKKAIPVKKDLPSHVTERYDINNKLITENK